MGLLEDIVSKLNPKEVGIHLDNYAQLYIKPLKIWRKVIGNRKDSYDLIILHLIYYCAFVFFIKKDIVTAIPIVILECVLTIIPLTVFIIPFIFYVKVFKKSYTWNKLFRLLLVLKLQFFPIFIIGILFVDSMRVESLYIFIENFALIIWLSFIVTFPLIIKLGIWRKLLWISTNYVFFVLAVVVFIFVFEKIDNTEKLFKKLSIKTPHSEYLDFELKELYPLPFNDEYYFTLIEKKNKSNYLVKDAQFVSFDLQRSFHYSGTKVLRENIRTLKYLKNRNYKLNKKLMNERYKMYYTKIDTTKLLTLEMLDSLKHSFNLQFYALLKGSKMMKDSAKFESNREYFSVLTEYLQLYERSYTDRDEMNKIINTSKIDDVAKLDSSYIGVMYKIDPEYYSSYKKQLNTMESKFAERSYKSTFIFSIIFYPIEIILEIFNYYDL